MLSELAIKEFIQIYKDKYGVVLSKEEAEVKAIKLYELIKILLTPNDSLNSSDEISKQDVYKEIKTKGGERSSCQSLEGLKYQRV